MPTTIGVRELKNQASRVLRAVREEMAKDKSIDEIARADVLAPWSKYGECPFLPYITDETWITAIYYGGHSSD